MYDRYRIHPVSKGLLLKGGEMALGYMYATDQYLYTLTLVYFVRRPLNPRVIFSKLPMSIGLVLPTVSMYHANLEVPCCLFDLHTS